MRVLEVCARGTSRWAHDGSGKASRSKVSRSKEDAPRAMFQSAKKYNADLNGALNIAARGVAMLLGIKPRSVTNTAPADLVGAQNSQARTGKSSGVAERMPLALADSWTGSKEQAQLLRRASHRPASPAGVLA